MSPFSIAIYVTGAGLAVAVILAVLLHARMIF
jgi:hypothetical protein